MGRTVLENSYCTNELITPKIKLDEDNFIIKLLLSLGC
jgi:hypothetical protein